MYTVKKKPLTANIIWDNENNKPLCRFVKGVLQTNDSALAEQLKGAGYEVTGEADHTDSDGETAAPETPEQPDSPDSDDASGETAAPAKTTRRSRK